MGKFAFHVEFSKITQGFIFNNTLFKDCKTSYIKFIDKRIQSEKTFLGPDSSFPQIELLETNFDS